MVRLPAPPHAVARFGDGSGRLVQMPAKAAKRRELLAFIAAQLPSRELSETEINAELREVHDDVAMVRRYLVDEGLVLRPEPGRYVVPPPPTDPAPA